MSFIFISNIDNFRCFISIRHNSYPNTFGPGGFYFYIKVLFVGKLAVPDDFFFFIFNNQVARNQPVGVYNNVGCDIADKNHAFVIFIQR